MNSNDDFKAIAALDLEPIKVKLMHEESGEGWTLERANAIEFEYRRFLILMKKYPNEQTAPLVDVDTFWHYHILDTLKYAADCEAVFGHFLHHFPYIGLRGEADREAHHRVGERMKTLYETTFGEAYLRGGAGQAAFSGAAANTAFSGVAAKTAFSGVAAKTAFSGVASQAAFPDTTAKAAFSGAAAHPAFSGVAAKTAFSGVAARGEVAAADAPGATSAFSGAAAGGDLPGFYTERPRLALTA